MSVDMLPGFEQCPGCDRVVVPTWAYCPMCGAALTFDDDADDSAILPGQNADPELHQSDLPTVDDEPADTYSTDAEGVIAALKDHGGELPQAEFMDLLDTYQSKVSILLSDMERQGQIERERMDGQHAGKVVRLPDDHDASADPNDDASDASDDDLVDEHPEPEALDPDAELDLSQYGQTGQVVTPELLIGALEGAQAVYQVKRHLHLSDREVEDILRKVGLYEELRNGTGKLERDRVERAVREAVEA